MKKENIAGFTLVLSLVLLLVMSLMGGALVVISSSDHKSNNDSDLYQQTFYVAETGLIEGEKELINAYMGNWQEGSKTVTTTVTDPDTGVETEVTETIGTYTRSQKVMGDWKPPSNENKADTGSACYRSFKNIVQQGSNKLEVVAHRQNQSFFDNLLVPIFNTQDFDQANKDVEEEVMKRYTYEYFMVNVGNAAYQEAGSSMSKGSVDAENTGTAYKVYACGIYNRNDIIIPLESIIVLPG